MSSDIIKQGKRWRGIILPMLPPNGLRLCALSATADGYPLWVPSARKVNYETNESGGVI